MKKCPPSICCWDLNPWSSEYESPPITTRPGLSFWLFNSLLKLNFEKVVLLSPLTKCRAKFKLENKLGQSFKSKVSKQEDDGDDDDGALSNRDSPGATSVTRFRIIISPLWRNS